MPQDAECEAVYVLHSLETECAQNSSAAVYHLQSNTGDETRGIDQVMVDMGEQCIRAQTYGSYRQENCATLAATWTFSGFYLLGGALIEKTQTSAICRHGS